jgi:TadE-like protein
MMRRIAPRLTDFARNDEGVTLVELAIVIPVFLLLYLGMIDFGRLGQEYVLGNKAMQIAARIAVVRPAACAGVPETNARPSTVSGTAPRFGTMCATGSTVCANPGVITCTGSITNPTVAEIWTKVQPIMPIHATPANLRFRYAFNQNLGFLCGPYVTVVTVEITNLNFRFATPLGAMAAFAGATSGTLPGTLPFPSMSVSLPAEDLSQGEAG